MSAESQAGMINNSWQWKRWIQSNRPRKTPKETTDPLCRSSPPAVEVCHVIYVYGVVRYAEEFKKTVTSGLFQSRKDFLNDTSIDDILPLHRQV